MMAQTKIEWCDKSWSPVTGCSPVSEGCLNCYAKRMAYRLKGRYGYPKDDPFKVTFHPDRPDEPLHWKKSSRIFVCSMGDLFHEDVHFDWQFQIWLMVRDNPKHTFLFLTKRPKEMKDFFEFLYRHPVWKSGLKEPLSNLMLGVSVENQPTANERIPILLQIPAAKRFISVEPMLGPVKLSQDWVDYLEGWDTEAEHGRHDEYGSCVDCPVPVQVQTEKLDWVICGGETGPHARPVHPDWVGSLRDQCQAAGVPFFFKGWGEWAPNCLCESKFPHKTIDRPQPGHMGCMFHCGKKKAGRLLDGKIWEEYPCLTL